MAFLCLQQSAAEILARRIFLVACKFVVGYSFAFRYCLANQLGQIRNVVPQWAKIEQWGLLGVKMQKFDESHVVGSVSCHDLGVANFVEIGCGCDSVSIGLDTQVAPFGPDEGFSLARRVRLVRLLGMVRGVGKVGGERLWKS